MLYDRLRMRGNNLKLLLQQGCLKHPSNNSAESVKGQSLADIAVAFGDVRFTPESRQRRRIGFGRDANSNGLLEPLRGST